MNANTRTIRLLPLCVPLLAFGAPDPGLVQQANAGDPEAALQVFNELEAEIETPTQRSEAERYLRQAASRGYGPAQHRLAGYIRESLPDTPEHRAEAAKWMRLAADQGIAAAQQAFGFRAAEGDGTKRDLTTAITYLKTAARQGEGDALAYLIKLYSEGEDSFGNKQPVDLREAIAWQEQVSLAPAAAGYQKMALAGLYLRLPQLSDQEREKVTKLVEAGLADGGSMDAEFRARLAQAIPGLVKPEPAASTPAEVAATASESDSRPAEPRSEQAEPAEKAPPASTPAVAEPDEARAAALADLEARVETLVQQCDSAIFPIGRRRTFWTFGHWASAQSGTPLTLAERGEWTLRRLVPLLQRYPNEVFSLLSAAPQTFPEATIKRLLPEPLQEAYANGMKQVVADYRAEEQLRYELSKNWDAARAGDARAQMALGLAYAKHRDLMGTSAWAEAIHWLNQAAGQGVPGAQEKGRELVSKVNGWFHAVVEAKDVYSLVEMYREKAASPLPDAHLGAYQAGQALLGGGEGEAEDIQEAVVLLENAARKGHADSMVELGRLYLVHRAQPVDEARALQWFKAAAETGNKEAQVWAEVLTPPLEPAARAERVLKVARAQTPPQGNSLDAETFQWFARYAARLGLPLESPEATPEPARASQSEAHTTVLQDMSGATLGKPDAMFRLGRRYEHADGVTRDLKVALIWYDKAAAAGHPAAEKAVGHVTALLAQEQPVAPPPAKPSP